MKPNIKDVAKACNVSTTTVSLVLNDKPNKISEETKELVRKVAAEMNYRPNLLSRSLITKKLGIVGLILPNIYGSFYDEFLQELILNLGQYNYNIILSLSNYDHENERSSVEKFIDYGVEAIILSGAYQPRIKEANEAVDLLAKSRTPFLIIGGYAMDSPHTTLSIDHVESGYIAAKHLLDLGHRNIGFIAEAMDENLNKLWIEGYKNALWEFNLDFNEDFIKIVDNKDRSSHILDYFLSKQITSILIGGRLLIYGIFCRAKEIGIKIPEDISIIAFDNSSAYDYIYPGLTCVTPPVREIAQDMGEILRELINNNSSKIDYRYKPELLIRNTTKALIN